MDPTSTDNQFIPCHLQGNSSVFDYYNVPKHGVGNSGSHFHEFREIHCQRSLTPSPGFSRSSIRISQLSSPLDAACRTNGATKAIDSSKTSRCSSDNQLSKQIFPWMKETRQIPKRRAERLIELGESASSGGEASPPGQGRDGGRGPGQKRARTTFTSSQLVELEKEFHFSRYLCRLRRQEMASSLKLSGRQIKIWFQNRRMKYKKDQKTRGRCMGAGTMTGAGDGLFESPRGPCLTPSPSPSAAYATPIFHSPVESSRSAYGVAVYTSTDLPCSPQQQVGLASSLAQGYGWVDVGVNQSHSCAMSKDSFHQTGECPAGVGIPDSPFIVDYGCVVTSHAQQSVGPCDTHMPCFSDFTTHCHV
ncbi:hypothetical protein JZ751_021663 [Albula glossodonta]|uniref:Homeobox domain-containing protein n=1 Tax=Albula glossodonta TaxID=121402 RepID=A0A8T2NHW6_9TELE|nr:hypothetical protein JZ751_021663 [Albula glossodonta]